MTVLWLILAAVAGACIGAVGMAACAWAGRYDDLGGRGDHDVDETYEPFGLREFTPDRVEWHGL